MLERDGEDVEFREKFAEYLRTIGRQLQNEFKVPDGEVQINMIIRGGVHIEESTMAKEKETIRGEHSREVIGIIDGR